LKIEISLYSGTVSSEDGFFLMESQFPELLTSSQTIPFFLAPTETCFLIHVSAASLSFH
jgi:hypothetical protein